MWGSVLLIRLHPLNMQAGVSMSSPPFNSPPNLWPPPASAQAERPVDYRLLLSVSEKSQGPLLYPSGHVPISLKPLWHFHRNLGMHSGPQGPSLLYPNPSALRMPGPKRNHTEPHPS